MARGHLRASHIGSRHVSLRYPGGWVLVEGGAWARGFVLHCHGLFDSLIDLQGVYCCSDPGPRLDRLLTPPDSVPGCDDGEVHYEMAFRCRLHFISFCPRSNYMSF